MPRSTSPSPARFLLALVIGTSVVALGACSSSKPTSPVASQSSTALTATSPAGTPASSVTATAPAASALSGTWHGHYSGSFTGTFVINWTQSGSALSGTIDLSTAGTAPITGSVSGGKINFGTVGSAAITYTGSVSGSTMSGTYNVAGSAGGSGRWDATKG